MSESVGDCSQHELLRVSLRPHEHDLGDGCWEGFTRVLEERLNNPVIIVLDYLRLLPIKLTVD